MGLNLMWFSFASLRKLISNCVYMHVCACVYMHVDLYVFVCLWNYQDISLEYIGTNWVIEKE